MQTARDLLASVGPLWAPPPNFTVSEWADARRKLSAEASAIPGQWRTSVVEYMREPMDNIGDPRVGVVVIKACAQVAKSELLLNVAGYLIDYDPSPSMIVQPTLEMAEAFSKDRVAPMIRDTPSLKKKVAGDKSRNAENTIKQKKFPGGHLTLIGANSPSGLASRPIRAVLADEIDRYPVSAGEEGDPLSLAIKRAATFWNKIVAIVSTPTVTGSSRIDEAYDEGDRREYHVPCPHCEKKQVLRWTQVKFENRDPKTARYECEHCDKPWTDAQRIAAVRRGVWVAREPFNGTVSYHITGMMSPFVTIEEGVREFLNAMGNPQRLKTWTNTYLGETWEEEGESLEPHAIRERAEEYESQIPDGVTLLTAGVDMQDDRAEIEVIGWGDDDVSWSIDYAVLYGDPSTPAFWADVRSYLKQIYTHPRFGEMIIRAACIDTGGHHTHKVYDFVRATSRVYGIKGVGGDDKPLVGTPTKNNYGKIPLFPVGVHTAKDLVFSRLAAKKGEAGYCHFPVGRKAAYYDGLTSEKKVTRYFKGVAKKEYVKQRARNEPLDIRVYGTAALELLNVDLEAQRRAKEQKLRREAEEAGKEKKDKVPSMKRGGFVGAWQNR